MISSLPSWLVPVVVLVILVAATGGYGWHRARKHAAAARSAARAAELTLTVGAEEVAAMQRGGAVAGPDARALARAAVAEAFTRGQFLDRADQVQARQQASMRSDGLAISVAPRPTPRNPAAVSDTVGDALDLLSAALRATADDIDRLPRSGGDPAARTAQAVDVLQAGWARLPLRSLLGR